MSEMKLQMKDMAKDIMNDMVTFRRNSTNQQNTSKKHVIDNNENNVSNEDNLSCKEENNDDDMSILDSDEDRDFYINKDKTWYNQAWKNIRKSSS